MMLRNSIVKLFYLLFSRQNRVPYKFAVDSTATAYTLEELVGVVGQNIVQPRKLWLNIRHPLSEWVHTAHNFYGIGQQSDNDAHPAYVNEHYLFSRLTTVDVLQLDSKGNYYGKAQLTGKMFSLVERIYANPGYDSRLLAVLKSIGLEHYADLAVAKVSIGKLKENIPIPSVTPLGRLSELFFALPYAVYGAAYLANEVVFNVVLSSPMGAVFRERRHLCSDMFVSRVKTAFTGKDYASAAQARNRKQLSELWS